MQSSAVDVDSYLAGLDPDRRATVGAVRDVDRGRAPLREQAGSALERRPVCPDGGAGSQVGSGDLENLPVGQIVGSMNRVRPTKDVMLDLVEEWIDATQRVASLMEDA